MADLLQHRRGSATNAPCRWAIRIAGLLVAAVALCGPAQAQTQPPWWNGRWRYRKLVAMDRGPDAPSIAAAGVWIHIRQGADHGGQDIRVIGPDGNAVPFGIVHATPEGRYLLGFEAPERRNFYAVYYDNPRAPAVEHALPKAGLIYETRPIPEGADAGSWVAAHAIISGAGAPYGAAYWPRVFDAYNPFGPQSDYIGIYRGYIECPSAGKYGFATMSDHSSFLLVDGKPVTQWVGSHNIRQGRQGQKSGTVQLTKGLHAFQYVHFAFGGPARGAAAWQPPGAKYWDIIPGDAFPALMEGRIYEGQQQGQPVCADFTCAPQSYCEAGEAKMTAFRFESKSSVAVGALIERYEWDFGDGQIAGSSQPRHVYLAPGVYSVTLRITSTAGHRASCTKKLKVEPIWNDLNFTQRKLNRFLEGVQRYRMDRLPTPALVGAWEFFKEIEKKDKVFEVARELDQRRDALEPAQLHDAAMEIAKHYQHEGPDLELAQQYLELALNSVPAADRLRRFNARLALCDHYFYFVEDLDRARQEYRRLRADFPQTNPARRREALIRIGDTHRNEGKVEEALRAYGEAEGDPAYAPEKPSALVIGAITHEVESYMRRGLADEALKRLEELLWYYPTMRLEGEPALLRVQANLIKQDFKAAKKQADIYILVGKDANFLPAVHVAAADACAELGLIEEAVSHYRTVLDDFPESPQVQEAETALRRLGE